MDLAIWARVPCDCEIFGLFSDLIPIQAVMDGGQLQDVRSRHGKVPDLMLRLPLTTYGQEVQQGGATDTLCELKLLNAGVSRYPRSGPQAQEKAVNRRARALQGEYEGKLSKLDQDFHGTAPGQTGPLVQRLRSFPRLQGLVIGAFSECSDDIHLIVDYIAESRCRYLAQSTGYATGEQEYSQIIGQIRRRLSTSSVRAISLCTLARVANVGAGSKARAKRRQWALREDKQMKGERRAYWNSYVNRGGVTNGGIHFFPG